jgi:hypothetical protein
LRDQGARKRIYRAVSRWSPDGARRGPEKLFFKLTGPPLAGWGFPDPPSTGPEEIPSGP